MNLLTYEEYLKFEDQDRSNGRWDYMKEVINLVQNEKFEKVLELGPWKKTIFEKSDTLDIREAYFNNLTYNHDATITPWPIEDKKYDLFIALQVWEHLGNKQKEAFKEVRRISKNAILSFPLHWNCPGNCHHNITEDKIAEWTLGIKPIKKIKMPCKVGYRIIYYFKF